MHTFVNGGVTLGFWKYFGISKDTGPLDIVFRDTEDAGELSVVRVEQRHVAQQIEAIYRLDAHLVWRRGEGLGVEVGHHEPSPIEDGVAVDGDSPLAWIASEEADEVEVIVAHHVDGDLRCLHRHEEVIAPVLPRDLQRGASEEGHLLRMAAVVALGDLHAPEDALVFGAHLCEISESEKCHAAVV